MYLLDTHVISELRKAGDGRADSRVVAWLGGVDAASFYVSAVTIMELELGILLVERRDKAQGGRLRAWMDRQVLREFADRTLPLDTAVALRCASLHCPDPRPGGESSSPHDAILQELANCHAELTRLNSPALRKTLEAKP